MQLDIKWKDVKDIYIENINEFGKHLGEPREIGKKKEKVSSKDKMMDQKQIGESLGITTEQVKQILGNLCVECGEHC